jgi:hypothetical protein
MTGYCEIWLYTQKGIGILEPDVCILFANHKYDDR